MVNPKIDYVKTSAEATARLYNEQIDDKTHHAFPCYDMTQRPKLIWFCCCGQEFPDEKSWHAHAKDVGALPASAVPTCLDDEMIFEEGFDFDLAEQDTPMKPDSE